MAQQFLQNAQIRATRKQVSGITVAERMGMEGADETRLYPSRAHDFISHAG